MDVSIAGFCTSVKGKKKGGAAEKKGRVDTMSFLFGGGSNAALPQAVYIGYIHLVSK